ncbi:MAG: hypothetical protein AAB654_02085, partial [Acidobacteriota bacterium]
TCNILSRPQSNACVPVLLRAQGEMPSSGFSCARLRSATRNKTGRHERRWNRRNGEQTIFVAVTAVARIVAAAPRAGPD